MCDELDRHPPQPKGRAVPFPSSWKETDMPTEIEKNRAELEALQLEELREAANERKAARAARVRQLKTVAMALRMSDASALRRQNGCAHRKGGKNIEQFFDGNDNNYSVIKHTLSHGPTIVICQRCQKVWERPLALHADASKEQRAEWNDEMTEYRKALALPTDNEPSGAVLFDFIPTSPVHMQHL